MAATMTLRLQNLLVPNGVCINWVQYILPVLLANIHLCALFHAQHLKRYGFSEILAPVVRDI